ncbi:hypothetical protein BCV70DRAFT_46489 [Testicularia cyperi]|uniref:BZIP domain-containing protein n=1 Tax=Testicularia cyperi TaxID=1882483 RepID=A0A317XHU0_9BASI|nr:hypothetical protein BCV70DRAFT_46489 [Testicularia cyperi]
MFPYPDDNEAASISSSGVGEPVMAAESFVSPQSLSFGPDRDPIITDTRAHSDVAMRSAFDPQPPTATRRISALPHSRTGRHEPPQFAMEQTSVFDPTSPGPEGNAASATSHHRTSSESGSSQSTGTGSRGAGPARSAAAPISTTANARASRLFRERRKEREHILRDTVAELAARNSALEMLLLHHGIHPGPQSTLSHELPIHTAQRHGGPPIYIPGLTARRAHSDLEAAVSGRRSDIGSTDPFTGFSPHRGAIASASSSSLEYTSPSSTDPGSNDPSRQESQASSYSSIASGRSMMPFPAVPPRSMHLGYAAPHGPISPLRSSNAQSSWDLGPSFENGGSSTDHSERSSSGHYNNNDNSSGSGPRSIVSRPSPHTSFYLWEKN